MNHESENVPEGAEARITALLLSELSAEEAAALQEAMAGDAQLTRLHAELRRTIDLVKEAAVHPASSEGTVTAGTPPRLSTARREQLLQAFKSVASPDLQSANTGGWPWFVPMGIAAALVALIGLLVVLNPFAQSRRPEERVALLEQLQDHDFSDKAKPAAPAKPASSRPNPAPGRSVFAFDTRQTDPNAVLPNLERGLPVAPRPALAGPRAKQQLSQSSSGFAAGGFGGRRDRNFGMESAPASEPVRINKDGNKVPTLGDVPGVGRFFKQPVAEPSSRTALVPARPPLENSMQQGAPTSASLSGLPTPQWVNPAISAQGGTAPAQPIDNLNYYHTAVPAAAAKPSESLRLGWSMQPAATAAADLENGRLLKDVNRAGQNSSGPTPAQSESGAKTDLYKLQPESTYGFERARTSALAAAGRLNVEIRGLEEKKETHPEQWGASQQALLNGVQLQESAQTALAEALDKKISKADVSKVGQADQSLPKPAASPAVPQPEIPTRENAFSTFSLNVADVSFKLAAASLEKGVMPAPATVRSEEFLNAFDYHDPEPAAGTPIGFTWERARYPFAQNRDVLRLAIKTAAQGRPSGYPLNVVLLLDKSGSMERADRVQIIREALRVLAGQLQPLDKVSIITFARTARLWSDGISGDQARQAFEDVEGQTPEGGTNLEGALKLAYQTAIRHYIVGGGNRVVLLTDGAANLGDVDPQALQRMVEAQRQQGVALDCFGVGWEGFNDDLLEVLSSHGDGRYGFLSSPEEAATTFAGQLAGALHVAAADVKVQVEFNPTRVTAYRQIGYAKHQLTKEQFRDNTVDAAELGAAESGNALYVVQVDDAGQGDLATIRVRYRVPGTREYREQAWTVPYTGQAVDLASASPALRLATGASAFSEWLVSSPFASEMSPDRLLDLLRGVLEVYGADSRPQKLEWMIRQAKSITGK